MFIFKEDFFMRRTIILVIFTLLFIFIACEKKNAQSIKQETFGALPSGEKITLFTLENSFGMQASVMNYGATLVSVKMADNMGQISEITLGFDSLKQYIKQSPYFGSTVGRYANRIAKGKFSLLEKDYMLAINNGQNHLHGGNRGFDKAVWQAETRASENEQTVIFQYQSPDGEEGYPGTVDVSVAYTLTDGNSLKIQYNASTTEPTVINLSNHTYFNLKDAGATDVLGHVMQINAESYTPVDETLIPTGEIAPVSGTPFDFQQPHKIGERIKTDTPQISIAGGYDHNFVLGLNVGPKRLAATVFEPTTGRLMNVITTEPGVQFYSGNFLKDLNGRYQATYNRHSGFCLETQHFPDSPNHPDFPSVILNPGEEFTSTTIYKFSMQYVGLDN
jgi:aldose 1-epimerase